jgi:hypothetical protein
MSLNLDFAVVNGCDRLLFDMLGVLGTARARNIFNIPSRACPAIAKHIKKFLGLASLTTAKSRFTVR